MIREPNQARNDHALIHHRIASETIFKNKLYRLFKSQLRHQFYNKTTKNFKIVKSL